MGTVLVTALDECFVSAADAPARIGHALASYWQGAMTWWAFDASRPLLDYLAEGLDEIIAMLVPSLRD